MSFLNFTARLEARGFDFDTLDSDENEDLLDPVEYTLMNDPVSCGEHTFDKEILKGWFKKCINENKPVTNPISREVVAYDPNKKFKAQFQRNLFAIKAIEKFVSKYESNHPLIQKPVELEKEDEKGVEVKEEPKLEIKEEKKIEAKEEKKPFVPAKFDERFDAVKPVKVEWSEEDGIVKIDVPNIKRKVEAKVDYSFYNSQLTKAMRNLMLNDSQIVVELLDLDRGIIIIDQFLVLRIDAKLLKEKLPLGIDKLVSSVCLAIWMAKSDFSFQWSDNYEYLSKICTLWEMRKKEPLDLTDKQDLQILMLKNILDSFKIKDVFQHDGVTWFRGNQLNPAQMLFLTRRLCSLISVFEKFDLDFDIKEWNEFYANQGMKEKKIPLMGERIIRLCLLDLHVKKGASVPVFEELKGYLSGIKGLGYENLTVSAQEANCLKFAKLCDYIGFWIELFAESENTIQDYQTKVRVLRDMLLECVKIHKKSFAHQELDQTLSQLMDEIGPFSKIMGQLNFGFSLKLTPVQRDKLKNLDVHNKQFEGIFCNMLVGEYNVFLVMNDRKEVLKKALMDYLK